MRLLPGNNLTRHSASWLEIKSVGYMTTQFSLGLIGYNYNFSKVSRLVLNFTYL